MNSPRIDPDECLAELLAQLSDALRAGTPLDVETLATANPLVARELRELWAVAQFADLAHAAKVANETHDWTTTTTDSGTSQQALPRSFGEYELLEEIGRGGMGVVYRARQNSLNRTVAIKMVREAHLASEAERSRFHAEAEAAARLKHPNIVTVHEVGEIDNQAFFCMEYVAGRTLAQRVHSEGPLPSREAARLVALIARAVDHAHGEQILHRDLKPANILLTTLEPRSRSGEPPRSTALRSDSDLRSGPLSIVPKVTDFGLAKRIDTPGSLTRTGAVVGTPSYMAPEQATGRKDLTPAADVYSLGAILYELLTGRPPFQAATAVDTLLLVLEQDVIPPRELNPSVDRDLANICLKCLQKPVTLRYATAAELATDLEAYLAGEMVSTRASSIGYFVSRLLRETHHAAVLENWGVLWMWHSLMIFLLCFATQLMAWSEVEGHAWYLATWSIGLFTWGSILWKLRRRAGPVLFVERQIAHAWAAGVCASIAMFGIEVLAGLPVLQLSPAIAVAAGMVMMFKAGILSGQFYLWAMLNFGIACVMAAVPDYAHLLFGVGSAVSFFVPGYKYYRQRARGLALYHAA